MQGMRQSVVGMGLVAMLMAPGSAGAVVRAQSEYPYDQVWNAVVRLVRVDLGFEVTERDAEGGFILFKYRGDTGTAAFNASIEIVRPAPDGKVGVVVQIPEMPRYTELWMVDRLNRKLRDEYGAPPVRVRRPPPATPPARDGDGDARPPRDGDARASRGTTTAGANAAARPRRNDTPR
jgi:hypothetical protein